MDTKSKKFKYTPAAKLLCLLLSAVTLFSGTFLVFEILEGCSLFGAESFFTGDIPSFTSTQAVANQLISDASCVATLANLDAAQELSDALSEKSVETVNMAVDEYLDQKAEIIREELEYAVENYDDSYFNYEYTADAVDIPTTEVYEDVTTSDGYVSSDGEDDGEYSLPRNIAAAQQILKTTEGRGFLNYEVLVRSDAFENEFSYKVTLTDIIGEDSVFNFDYYYSPDDLTFQLSDMTASESSVKKDFLSQYDSYIENCLAVYNGNIDMCSSYLGDLKNLKYYVLCADGTVYTNLSEKPDDAVMQAYGIYAYTDNGAVIVAGVDDEDTVDRISEYLLAVDENAQVYMILEEGGTEYYTGFDVYYSLRKGYDNLSKINPVLYIISSLICAVASIALLAIFLLLCGHKNGKDEPVTAFIDKMPNDIHFILSMGLIVLVIVLFGIICDNAWPDAMFYTKLFTTVFSLAAVLCWLLFAEWLASVVRIKKAGKPYFKHTVIAKIVIAVKNLIVKLAKRLSYKPKKLSRNIILIALLYVIGNLILGIIGSVTNAVVGIIFLLVYNAVMLALILKQIITLDRIIAASCEHKNVVLDESHTPKSLRLLAENLTNTNEQLDRAIEKAVKNEQMKTELITNVSHDLKTPLTSLITYSDILKRCDITDENAVKYIGVINDQSTKLKRLIEDLIEASKVSTGNVTLNKSLLNLSEIAAQAIVEFEPEMQKNGNEIRFSEPETAPTVFADGSKTYRIISNLLSNAKKYSAPDTRVYVSIYNDSAHGYFEIKNISKEPLNISPDELTERFVRGDESRTKEGNGLGLSIAKDLCKLQDGELKLIIDGDLFKAIVSLPSGSASPFGENSQTNDGENTDNGDSVPEEADTEKNL